MCLTYVVIIAVDDIVFESSQTFRRLIGLINIVRIIFLSSSLILTYNSFLKFMDNANTFINSFNRCSRIITLKIFSLRYNSIFVILIQI
jgi:hypothetical protein